MEEVETAYLSGRLGVVTRVITWLPSWLHHLAAASSSLPLERCGMVYLIHCFYKHAENKSSISFQLGQFQKRGGRQGKEKEAFCLDDVLYYPGILPHQTVIPMAYWFGPAPQLTNNKRVSLSRLLSYCNCIIITVGICIAFWSVQNT